MAPLRDNRIDNIAVASGEGGARDNNTFNELK
jgi:hypothetical protein